MMIILFGVVVTLLLKAGAELASLLETCLLESLQECITDGSFTYDEYFYLLKYIISTNT